MKKTRGLTGASNLTETIRAASVAADVWAQLDYLGKIRVPRDLGHQLQAAWEAGLAPNWRGLDDDEVAAAVGLMVDHGLNVAWAPRVEVVRLLVTVSDTAERDAILVGRAGEVLDDVDENLVAITRHDFAEAVDAVREAVANCRDGRHRSCIALVVVVLTALVHGPLGHQEFSRARKRYENLDPEDALLSEFREYAVLRCLHRAILRTDEWSGSGFNRHAAAHSLHAEQYTHANAVGALLLLTGLLRELERSSSDVVLR